MRTLVTLSIVFFVFIAGGFPLLKRKTSRDESKQEKK